MISDHKVYKLSVFLTSLEASCHASDILRRLANLFHGAATRQRFVFHIIVTSIMIYLLEHRKWYIVA